MTTLKTRDDKEETRRQWNRTPCGTGDFLARLEPESLAWFDEVRRSRYEVSDTWMPRVMPFREVRGKRLLEVGHGIGSDLLTFAQNGAEVCGIDITEEHHRLAKKNFELHGIPADLRLGDAASLPWPDASFDVVYSHGVLHHTPDIQQCVREAHRVLRPGGLFVLSVYRFWSAFHLASMVFTQGLLRRRLFRLGYSALMATIEQGADGVHIKPLVRTYTRRQLGRLLSAFATVRYEVAHLQRDQFGAFHRLTPRSVVKFLEPRLGWYIVVFATK
jgi:ubiquinone/menaquinone biosynthesis C-methylase UbiE